MKHQLRIMIVPPEVFEPWVFEEGPFHILKGPSKMVYFVCNNCEKYLQVEKATLAEWLLGADIIGEELSETLKKWQVCPNNVPMRLHGIEYTGRRIDAETVGDARGVPLLRSV